jgi:hypothetical protein
MREDAMNSLNRRSLARALISLTSMMLMACPVARADTFCDDLIKAIDEGKNDFTRIKGGKLDRPFPEYATSFRFTDLPGGRCNVRADEQRAAKLSLWCSTARIGSESDARDLYNRLKDELTSCVRGHYPTASTPRNHPFRTTDNGGGFEYMEIQRVAETGAGWSIATELTLARVADSEPHASDYRVDLAVNST